MFPPFLASCSKMEVHGIHSKSGKSGGDGYFGQQKLAEKMRKYSKRKSQQKCVNREIINKLLK